MNALEGTAAMATILIVEDDRDIAGLVALHLRDNGHDVTTLYNGADGLDEVMVGDYDVLVLDVMLPGMDGLELCRYIRTKKPNTLILMLTAKSAEIDRILGLEIGADDYLTKPFSVREVQARVKALLRRKEKTATLPEAIAQLVVGELSIDFERHEVKLADEKVNLTVKEFDLLVQFARHPGKVYTRTQLLDLVWGSGYEGFEHTVNSHINRLRAKIERNPAEPLYIQTVWGVGYKFTS
ncbi:MAG: response regulator transcription factor [Trueperaceae bacterium]